MHTKHLSRRKFLSNAFLSVAWLISSLVAGCKKSSAPKTAGEDFLACSSDEDIGEESLKIRKSLQYVDLSPIQTRRCDNCKLYKKPEINSGCGGCKLFSGSVKASAYCLSWYRLM